MQVCCRAGDDKMTANIKALKEQVTRIEWPTILLYGNVTIQVRDGKPVLLKLEETVKLD